MSEPDLRQRQQQGHRQQPGDAERAVQARHTEEETVQERTAELQEANRWLQQEIAERRRSEEALQQSERMYATIAENLPYGMVQILDRDLRYVFSAGDQLRHVGLSNEVLVGKSVYYVLSPEGAALVAGECKRVLEGEAVTFEGDYADHTFLVNGVPLPGPGGEVDQILLLSVDITRRRRAELALEEYSERLDDMVGSCTKELYETQQHVAEASELNRKIIAASPVGITAYAASGDCVLANEAAARIVGATRDQVLDQNFKSIASWQEAGLLEAAQTALCEHRETGQEAHLVSTFGRDIWIDCRFIPFALRGKPHLLVVTNDVTEHRRLQEQLIRQEKLAALGRLSGSVSHELRNPLGAIRNAAYFLRLAVGDPDPDVREAVDILRREVDRSEAVIKGLLDFTRSRSPTRQRVDLPRLLEQALAILEIPAEIEVVVRLDDRLPVVWGDPDQLQGVFVNIGQNAVQAMPDGGRLVVEARATTAASGMSTSETRGAAIRSSTGRGSAEISISDTGPGISAHQQDRIFEPLFSTRPHGIGLGLAIAREIVIGHGGAIELESPSRRATAAAGREHGATAGAGGGTTFVVTLPAVEAVA